MRAMSCCKFANCNKLTPTKYCDNHRAYVQKIYDQERRNDDTTSFYKSNVWQQMRLNAIRNNPVCQHCKCKPSQHVHHLKRAADYPELRLTLSNLECLCQQCHARETAYELKQKGIWK